MSNEKIISVAEAKALSKSLKKTNKIVLCHGAFDLMHTGHIRHLQKAKQPTRVRAQPSARGFSSCSGESL